MAHSCVKTLHWNLNTAHFGDTNIKYLEVKGSCRVCGKEVRFRGPAGVNPNGPTTSIFGDEASLPFLFDGEEYDGKGIGMSVSTHGPD